MNRPVITILLAAAVLAACTEQSPNQPEYETQWFSYPDSTYIGRNRLCKVNYYVSGDTLYTSEKYHFLTLVYSWETDSTLAYQHMVFFDREQTDSAGWYRLPLNREVIPREPQTYLSGIVLRSYMGDKYDYKHKSHADAYLYNIFRDVSDDDVRQLTPELQKLLPTIK